MMFSILIPAKSREITFRGEIICEGDSAFVELFFSGSEELALEADCVSVPRLEGFCFLAAGFFIGERAGFAERVEVGLPVSRSTT